MKKSYSLKPSHQIRSLVLFLVLGGAIGRPFDSTAEGMMIGALVAAIIISLAESLEK
jgi:hypothetical protein